MGKSCVCVKCGHRFEPPKGLKPGGKKNKEEKKNPFEEYGRDKFLELKAEIEEKKRKIMKAIGEDDVLMLRFKYTDDNKLKPIIVTADKSGTPKKAPTQKENNPEDDMSKKKAALVEKMKSDPEVVDCYDDEKKKKKKKKSALLMGLEKMQVMNKLNVQMVKKLNNVQATHAYLAAVVIMILLLIALLKRQAQLCANTAGVVATR